MSFTPSWDKLDVFTSVKDFGVLATIVLADGSQRQVPGIYDEPYMNAHLGEYENDSSAPRFTAKESDLAGIKRGDVATIGGKQYDVMRHPEPDGTGMATLRLAAA
jgi:hypothetical protein